MKDSLVSTLPDCVQVYLNDGEGHLGVVYWDTFWEDVEYQVRYPEWFILEESTYRRVDESQDRLRFRTLEK